VIIRLSQASDSGEARRQAAALAERSGFDAEAAGRVAIVATELATNILKHAGTGEIAIEAYDGGADGGGADDGGAHREIELLAIDNGPGMDDFARCLEDGYSTAGSQGAGLGAVHRLSGSVSVFTRPGLGTVIAARLAAQPTVPARWPFTVGAVAMPYPGETVSGDGWAIRRRDAHCRLMVVDGSGHGPLAAQAAQAALQLFAQLDAVAPDEAIAAVHRALGATRGAAVALAAIELPSRLVRYAGLGNISGTLIDDASRRGMVSTNGTAGHVWRKVREYGYPFAGADPIIILHSDGIATRWQLDSYPGLVRCHPSVIAGVLYRDHTRGRDDATVVVVKPGAA
jgi:anti-sigma regulatory factor (Ser/Thr protein kinase)